MTAVLRTRPAVMAIGLGFDAINGEHNRRTLSRILAQPIYRDALLAGKFLAGITVLAVNLTALWLLVVGLGVLRKNEDATFTLRNQNLLLLMGTQDEVSAALSADRDLPEEFATLRVPRWGSRSR